MSACAIIPRSFPSGLFAGLALAAAAGAFLFQLWQPERQVQLHSVHLLRAIEQRDWAELASFIALEYGDQWGNDRSSVLLRLREVLSYTRNLRLDPVDATADAAGVEGRWRARITVEADPGEVATAIKNRVNELGQPFELEWRKQSGKPWDWKLVRVTNPALALDVP